MNFFLDTTILYNDPFLANTHNKTLVNMTKNHNFRIYISDVVYQENKNHYLNRLEDINKQINEILYKQKGIATVLPSIIQPINIDLELKKLEDHYNDLGNNNIVTILPVNNSILPELINRSIHRKKPFTDKKQEFRDAIIWLTYAHYAETMDLEDCYFITDNISDFFKNNKIHPDLEQDSKRFTPVKKVFSLLNKPEIQSKVKSSATMDWIDDQNMNQEKWINLFSDSVTLYEFDAMDVFSIESDYLIDIGYVSGIYTDGAISITEVQILHVNIEDTAIVDDEINLKGSIDADCTVEIILFHQGDILSTIERILTVKREFYADWDQETGRIAYITIENSQTTDDNNSDKLIKMIDDLRIDD